MADAIDSRLPEDFSYIRPNGGMFIWLKFPEGISSSKVFEKASKENVVILPGFPFFTDGSGDGYARLNFTNSSEEEIIKGIDVLAGVIDGLKKN